MNNIKVKIPYFTKGSLEDLRRVLNDTESPYYELDAVMYHYVTEGESSGSLILVDTDKTLNYITIRNINEIINSLNNHEERLENIENTIENISNNVGQYDDRIEQLENDVDLLENSLEGQVEFIMD